MKCQGEGILGGSLAGMLREGQQGQLGPEYVARSGAAMRWEFGHVEGVPGTGDGGVCVEDWLAIYNRDGALGADQPGGSSGGVSQPRLDRAFWRLDHVGGPD